MIGPFVALFGPLLKITGAPPPVPRGSTGVRVFLASPRYLSYRYLLTVLAFLPAWSPLPLMLAAFAVASRKHDVPVWLGVGIPAAYALVVLCFLVLALVSARLDYDFHCYVGTDRSLRIRRGIWEQVEATLTYANVQNVRVIQGPLERFFGIASVVVETAGGTARQAGQQEPRGMIRGIENANDLRDRIMDRMRASKSAGLGDPDDHEHGHAEAHLPIELLREIRDEARGLAADLQRSGIR